MSEHDSVIGESAGEHAPVDSTAGAEPSLVEDVKALVDDGKTYLEAELQFQKSRAALAVSLGKTGAAYGVAAAAFLHLALIGLVVGLIFSLTPVLTAWGATAVVVAVLLIVGALLGLAATRRFARLRSAVQEDGR